MPTKAAENPAQAGRCQVPEPVRLAEEAPCWVVASSQTQLQLYPGFTTAYLCDH